MARRYLKKFDRGEVTDPLQLTPRDVALLRDVAEFRFLNTPQILALHPGGERNLLRRLAAMFSLGFLDSPKTQGNAQLRSSHLVYSLGRKSVEALAAKPEEREWILRRVREVEHTSPILGHALMISQLRVCLTLALRKKGSTIERWLQGRDLKDALSFRGANPPLVPDAFFTIKDEGDSIHYFVEADRGTMTTERFVSKMKIYWSWKDDQKLKDRLHIEHFRVLTITPTEGRSESLRLASKEANTDKKGSRMFLFAPETRYGTATPEEAIGKIWKSPKDDTAYSVLDN